MTRWPEFAIIELARRQKDRFTVGAVRLDSGDLADLAFQTRQLLDQAGLEHVTIFASNWLDEHQIRRLVQTRAPINAFGVGTKLVVSSDALALDMAYKLVEYAGQARSKLSSEKVLLPGRKQVFRTVRDGCMVHDVLGCWEERQAGQPLLCHVMQRGRRIPDGNATLKSARDHARQRLTELPPSLKSIDPVAAPYSVVVSDSLRQKIESIRHKLVAQFG